MREQMIWQEERAITAETELAKLRATAARLLDAVETLTYALACERPLREPETPADVLTAWDRLEIVMSEIQRELEGE